MNSELIATILAAGEGKRLNMGSTPKALVPIAGKPVLGYAMNALMNSAFYVEQIRVSAGLQKKHFAEYLDSSIELCYAPPNGTLGAVESALTHNQDVENICVIHADDALNLRGEQIQSLLDRHLSSGAVVTLLLTHDFRPGVHGMHYDVDGDGIVHTRMPVHTVTGTLNVFTGIYVIGGDFMRRNAARVVPDTKGERKITDLFTMRSPDELMAAVVVDERWYGINTPTELYRARVEFDPRGHQKPQKR